MYVCMYVRVCKHVCIYVCPPTPSSVLNRNSTALNPTPSPSGRRETPPFGGAPIAFACSRDSRDPSKRNPKKGPLAYPPGPHIYTFRDVARHPCLVVRRLHSPVAGTAGTPPKATPKRVPLGYPPGSHQDPPLGPSVGPPVDLKTATIWTQTERQRGTAQHSTAYHSITIA